MPNTIVTGDLAQRVSKYIGLNSRSPYGPVGNNLGIEAAKVYAPWATRVLDFGETSFPVEISTTSALTGEFGVTATAAGATSNTVGSNAGNGYMHIVAGTVADTGPSLQFNVAARSGPLMRFVATPNTSLGTNVNGTITATRDIFWSIRCAFKCGTTTPWSSIGGKVFMGISKTSTAIMTAATGALPQGANFDQGIGFHIGETGVIRGCAAETTVNNAITFHTATAGYTLPTMASTVNGVLMATLTNAWTAASFHEYSFHAHWENTLGTNANSFVDFYFDGNRFGRVSGASILPDWAAASSDMFNSIEILNGASGTTGAVEMGVAHIVNAVPRYHII